MACCNGPFKCLGRRDGAVLHARRPGGPWGARSDLDADHACTRALASAMLAADSAASGAFHDNVKAKEEGSPQGASDTIDNVKAKAQDQQHQQDLEVFEKGKALWLAELKAVTEAGEITAAEKMEEEKEAEIFIAKAKAQKVLGACLLSCLVLV